MTANLCVRCAAPMPDQAYVCRGDAQTLAEALVGASGHAEDAETVIARQARYGAGSRGGSDEPLPVDLTASTRYAVIGNTVTTWARHVLDEEGGALPAWRPAIGPLCAPLLPGDPHRDPHRAEDAHVYRCEHDSCVAIRDRTPQSALAEALGWLATQVGWIRKRPEAREAFAGLHDACEQLARLVDRPADKELVGMCDCGKVLYAAHGRTVVRCPEQTCKLKWDVEESREILRKALDGKLVTAAEAARLGAYLDTDRTQDGIRKLIAGWVKHGLLAAHGEIREEPDDPDGEPKITPTYRFGDITNRLARTPRRKSRAGVAA